MWWGSLMGRGKDEKAAMAIPTRCARCLNVNEKNTIMCDWCTYEDARASHVLEGHDKPIQGCPGCVPPPTAFI